MNSIYNKELGYCPYSSVNIEKIRHTIKVCKALIEEHYTIHRGDKILVAGTGEAIETELIFDEFHEFTIGVDKNLHADSHYVNQSDFFLQKQNLLNLAFSENSFSLIYCYHVLEHVNQPILVLQEFCRVLKPAGILFLGFPNKNRLIAYIGTYKNSTLAEKIAWNINDYRYRLIGKFENKYGSHAGFTNIEFIRMASDIFQRIIPLRDQYMFLKYKWLNRYRKFIVGSKLTELLFPSNYYICQKEEIGK